MIKTALHQPGVARDGNYKIHIWRLLSQRFAELPVDETDSGAAPAVAEVIRGNWVAGCPDCNGYIVIEPGMDYFCPDCENAGIGRKWRPIEWPANRAAIENVLDKRPIPENRNWLNGEKIQDLKRENREHELGE